MVSGRRGGRGRWQRESLFNGQIILNSKSGPSSYPRSTILTINVPLILKVRDVMVF
jgi:hypothetical protein